MKLINFETKVLVLLGLPVSFCAIVGGSPFPKVEVMNMFIPFRPPSLGSNESVPSKWTLKEFENMLTSLLAYLLAVPVSEING